MRTHGTIEGVRFTRLGYSIYELGEEYRLSANGRIKVVYVNSMKELREAIATFQGVHVQKAYEHSEVAPLQAGQ